MIKQKKNDLNKLCHIEKTPGQHPGAQLSFADTLKEHTTDFKNANPNHPKNEPMRVKISCDGAKMSRSANFMILSFSLLQTGDLVMSSKGNRTIGIVNGPESYDTLKDSFSELFKEINEVNKQGKIKDGDNEIPVDLFLGGDYKFLLMVMGLSGATSDYSCLWCRIHKHIRWDMSKPLDYYHEKINRSIEDILENNKKAECSCKNKPLLEIEVYHIILDELHLMLRISDRLLENLIKEVMEKDGKEDFDKSKKQETGLNLKKLIKTMNLD